jgi:hypothetical protein
MREKPLAGEQAGRLKADRHGKTFHHEAHEEYEDVRER